MARAPRRNDIETLPPAMDYASHERQYRRFLHLLKWFVVHVALLLGAVYSYLVASQPVAGTLFLVLGLAALGYGIVTTSGIRQDIEAAVESAGHPGQVGR